MADSEVEKRSLGKDGSITSEPKIAEVGPQFTQEEEKNVARKVDMVILPAMCFVFFFQYLDKQTLSYASVFGLITDLEMEGSQYSWCTSIFYIGQLVAEYPFIYLMSRLPLVKFVAVTIVIWGGLCMCLAAPNDFASFAAVRFLLGFAEGAVSPSFVTFTSIWYRKEDHPLRIGCWVTMNALAQPIGCLLMYGIGKTIDGFAPWRCLFLVCGAMTVVIGVAFYFVMPTGPQNAWFLNEREKEILMARMAKDHEGGDKTKFSIMQLKEALGDVKTWFVFVFGVLVTMCSPVLTFASLILNNIGYNKFDTMLYTAPSGVIQGIFIWIGLLLNHLLPRHRSLITIFLIIPPLIGSILLLKLPISTGWGMIVASWLASCISDVMVILLSLSASNTKGNTKRAVVNTFFFIGYCAGLIGAPQLWTDKPRYFEGVVTSIVDWVLLVLVMGAYWWVCRRENKKRDRNVLPESNFSFPPGADVTDKEDVTFRYNY